MDVLLYFLLQWMPNPLTENMMKEGLSLLCKTGNGLAHAYVKLELKDRCVYEGPIRTKTL